MPPLPTPISVVLCGKTPAVGKTVTKLLLPEYDVIHFISSYEAGQAELVHVLAGKDPHSPSPNDIGTHKYGKPIHVVIFGRAFEPAQVEELRKTCAGVDKESTVWLVGELSKMPTGPPPASGASNYAENAVNEVKEALSEWKDQGGVKGGVILY